MKYCNIIICCLFIATSIIAPAQNRRGVSGNDTRDKLMREMQESKRNFMTREMGLSSDQAKDFFVYYEKMDAEKIKLNRNARFLERNITKAGSKVTDADYEHAADVLAELKYREGEIEKRYYEIFKKILTKKQLFMMKRAEQRFAKDILQKHRNN